ncbi:PRC-barrel domain-containing protein [Solwaraspora sp. WMMB335]|uniref:PRC-barrel domain-containing protein n=1 Tax=Solwaraspora sp. WMMB335 TaxID=3404118 RepID=UPI003B964A64
MKTEGYAKLIKMSDAHEMVADPAEDIRGRKVHDTDGNEIGKVDDLLIDEAEHKVRMLRVEHGGILGIGATASFIPVDAVTRITDDVVHINESRERVSGAPAYDPDLVSQDKYYEDLYGYYGYLPFWGVGYVYPGYPYYR